eukprot:gnl/TRDRNA2_/TRDRNA2_145928_c0_seq1.p1 gnl/TRDRNA2_/TRDRNA2_145928_c0~~gnl/TRDRNA2_/TRDRNA2_145928_c0_seq1.p1  ORF type:complete len:568 (+),score=85.45 gnl/TRDRNA2_/TRDRNA2_145928_c0_seq1:56-1705(+)
MVRMGPFRFRSRTSAVTSHEEGAPLVAANRSHAVEALTHTHLIRSVLSWPGRRSYSKPTVLPSGERSKEEDNEEGTHSMDAVSLFGERQLSSSDLRSSGCVRTSAASEDRPISAPTVFEPLAEPPEDHLPGMLCRSPEKETVPVSTTAPTAKTSGILSSTSVGLAARRGKMLGISSKPGVSTDTAASGKDANKASQQSVIVRIPDGEILKRYAFGKEVMPSCHEAMEVLFARRLSDSMDVVVKKRGKARSFQNGREERQWRATTEMMLNLPQSENICQLYEVLEDSHAYYVVMERVEGEDLCEALGQGTVSMLECRAILTQLLTAVAQLHTRGCIHKDLKLENVMLDTTPKTRAAMRSKLGFSPSLVKIIDFDTVEEWTPKTPKAKEVLGTDQYIAQEAYAGQYSPASDVFAVGVIAYKLLTGDFPYDDNIFDDLPGENCVGSKKMKQIRRRLKSFQVDWSHKVFADSPELLDFVKGLLMNNENERLEPKTDSSRQRTQEPWPKAGAAEPCTSSCFESPSVWASATKASAAAALTPGSTGSAAHARRHR